MYIENWIPFTIAKVIFLRIGMYCDYYHGFDSMLDLLLAMQDM